MSRKEELINLKVPEMYYTRLEVRKDYCELVEQYHSWMAKDRSLISENLFDELIQYDYPTLYSQEYRFAKSNYHVLVILMESTLHFLIDDITEKMARNNEFERMKGYYGELFLAFDEPSNINLKDASNEAILFANFCEEIRNNYSNKKLVEYFLRTVRNAFQVSLYVQLNYRSKGQYLNLNEYMEYRVCEVGNHILITFLELSLEIEIDDKLRAHPDFKLLALLCNHRIIVSHDMINCQREYISGEVLNYVFSYAYQNQCSLQTGLDAGGKYLKQIDADIDACVDRLKANDWVFERCPNFLEYINGLHNLTYGFYEWNLESVRYRVTDNEWSRVDWTQLELNMRKRRNESDAKFEPLENIIGADAQHFRAQH